MEDIFKWLDTAIGDAEHFISGAAGVFSGLRNVWDDASSWFSGGHHQASVPAGYGSFSLPWYGWAIVGLVVYKVLK